jgi:hypothetical protein
MSYCFTKPPNVPFDEAVEGVIEVLMPLSAIGPDTRTFRKGTLWES